MTASQIQQTGQTGGRPRSAFPSKVWVVTFSPQPGWRETARVFLTEKDAMAFQDALHRREGAASTVQAAPFIGVYRNDEAVRRAGVDGGT